MATVTTWLVGNGSSLSWTPPSTATAKVECWGAGQAGNSNGDAGSSGGYSVKNAAALTAGVAKSFQLGAPGTTPAQNGGDTWFGTSGTVLAPGGGSGTTAVGDITSPGTAGVLNGANSGGGAGGGSGAPGPSGLGNQGGLASANTDGGGGGGGSGGGAVGDSTADSVIGANGGNGPFGTGGVGGTAITLNGAKGGLGAGGGGGYGDSVKAGVGGSGGADFNHGGGGGGSGGFLNADLGNGGAGGTPGGGGGPGYGVGVQGRGGYSVIKITYTGTDPDQTLLFGDPAQGSNLVLTTTSAALVSAGRVLVSATLGAFTSATLQAAGNGPTRGALALTTGATTLSSAGTVLVSGTLSAAIANATLFSGGAGVAGTLALTTANAAISSAGKALVVGGLTATTQSAGSTTSLITISPVVAQPNNTAFTISGTFSLTPIFSYADDMGSAVALPAGSSLPVLPTIPWTFTHPGLTSGAHNITITDLGTGTNATVSVVINGGQLALTLTTANAVLNGRGGPLVAGTLNVTTNATLVARGTAGSGQLKLTLQDAMLVAHASVPIIGHLTKTLVSARLRIPSVPRAQRGIATSFPKGVLPVMAGGDTKFVQKQTDQIASVVSDLLIQTPQGATVTPTKLFDGMKRLARAPWRPAAGQTGDAWVYWDAAAQLWRLEGTAPTNT